MMCNNGFHTIHHNRAGLHWSVLRAWHDKEVAPRIDRRLDQRSMLFYLLETYVLHVARPTWVLQERGVSAVRERLSPARLQEIREKRKLQAELATLEA